MINMGTPENREGVEHWSNKHLFAIKFRNFLHRPRGFWFPFLSCCGKCDAGPMMENMLEDVTKVSIEANYGGRFRPDILLERKYKPPSFIEVVYTSSPSPAKLKYCAEQGIDLFEIDGSRRPIESAMLRAHIAPANCRKERRQALGRIFARWSRRTTRGSRFVAAWGEANSFLLGAPRSTERVSVCPGGLRNDIHGSAKRGVPAPGS